MTARFDLVTIDTPDPDALGRFWAAVLDLRVVEREDEGRWVLLADLDGARRIGLQRGLHRAGGIHLDLVCAADEIDHELERLRSLGATVVGPVRPEPYGAIVNLRDPDGNAFDLCAYAPGERGA